MVFSSLTFIVFFLPITLIAYFCFKSIRQKNIVLLLFSILFYSWGEPKWVLVMLVSVTVNYFCALFMTKCSSKAVKKLWLSIGVISAVAFLVYFKYFSFICNSILKLAGSDISVRSLMLPIGISFYTFQLLTYIIDVYRGQVNAQKSYIDLMLYISFFPQLIAGPIVRYSCIEKFLSNRSTDIYSFYDGFSRFVIGLAKKVLLANVFAELLGNLTLSSDMSTLSAWLSAVSFMLQIYFDFSGYSDMAIGLGCIFGFKFEENFNYPYTASSVTDFWRRWHISLGTFFREYVYIPLGGNRVNKGRYILNILIVWLLTGLWHGASYNFILWGLYYCSLLLIEKLLLKNVLKKIPYVLRMVSSLFFVLIGWIIFYHTSISGGIEHISALFNIGDRTLTDSKAIYCLKHYLGFYIIAVLACIPWNSKLPLSFFDNGKEPVLRGIAITVLFILSLIFLVGQSYNPFLYFRF